MNNLPLPPRIIGRGDSIDVLTKLDSGWWDGWCHGERGWFPSNYVQEDTPEEDMYTSHEAHLPDGWTIQMAEDGHTRYYYNQHTGQMSYEPPPPPTTTTTIATKEEHIIEKRRDYRESFFRPKQPIETKEEEEHQPTEAELMDNWVERQTPQGRVYFCNLITQETTWDYNEIDTETGRLTVETNENQKDEEEEEEGVYFRDAVQEQSIPQELTWNKIASDIALGIHELSTVTTKKQKDQVQPKTLSIVESIRLMLYASRTLDKDSLLLQEPSFREPRRAITSTLSKLVLDTKLSGDLYDSAWTSLMFEKIQRDANELMVSVRNFVSLCQQREVDISHISPRFIQPSDIPTIEPVSPVPSLTTGMAHLGIGPEDRQRVNKATKDSSLNQKTRYLLNQDLVVSLQVYSHQIYTSAEELSATAQRLLTLFQRLSGTGIEERTSLVSLFKTLSNQIGQYIAILDNINFDSNPIPSMVEYKISRQNIYSAIGHLFGAVQTLTDLEVDLPLAIQKLDEAVIHVENVIETVEQSVIAMVNERKHSMGREDEKEDEAEFGGFDDGKLALRRPTMGMVGISDIVNRRRQQSIRPDDRTVEPWLLWWNV
ncbi:hypothetical protein G6F56_007448 [Rhizopus delemar]|nr:hypothetical protein G6F56_007448 [Rhizopus delemar]